MTRRRATIPEIPEDPLENRVRESGVAPNRETEFCKAWRRAFPLYTSAYDILVQGLWYLGCGILMVPTPIIFGGGEKRTDTRQSVMTIIESGYGKDRAINILMSLLTGVATDAGASHGIRMESLDGSHEEQLRGGKKKAELSVIMPARSPGPDQETETKKVTLWFDNFGILGSDLAYLTEGLLLLTDRDYGPHRRYLRNALNPYGENPVGKRLVRESFRQALSYYAPSVLVIAFQPEEITAQVTTDGLTRRFLPLMASPSSTQRRRITDRGWQGPRDPIRDMGIFDAGNMTESEARRIATENLEKIGKMFWGRPYNRWIIESSRSSGLTDRTEDIANLLKQLEADTIEGELSQDEFEALKAATDALKKWSPRHVLTFTPAAEDVAKEIFNIVMGQIEGRGEAAHAYTSLMRTSAQNVLARLAGITASVAIANGRRTSPEVLPEDVWGCAFDFRDFMDMGLAFVMRQSGNPYQKPLREDVTWVVEKVRALKLIHDDVPAKTVKESYEEARHAHPGWRTWDRVRGDLRALGLVKDPPPGRGQDTPIELSETGLGTSLGGESP